MAKLFFSRLRFVASIIAFILAVTSGCFFWAANELAKTGRDLEKAVPIRLEIDVSKAGQYSCSIEHSQYVEYAHHGAILSLEHESDLTMRQIHSKLHGKIELLDDNGNVCYLIELPIENIAYRLSTDEIKGYPASWVLYPFTSEKKEFRLTVTKPLTELAGVKQSLRAYYMLNGIEFMSASICGLWGFIFASTAILIMLTIWIISFLKKRSHKRSQFEDYIKSSMLNDK